MHSAREKLNGSKKLQLLSNTSHLTYWLGNYIFDLALNLFNISMFVAVLAVMSSVRNNNPKLDIYLLTSSSTIAYLFLVLFLSALNWPVLCYCWLHFFKSDITGFVVLLISLGIGAFIDIFLSFVQIFMHITDDGLLFESSSSLFIYVLRLIVCIICPNVTLKRILFDFRLKPSLYCISTLNRILKINFAEDASFLSFAEPGISSFIVILLFQFAFSVTLLTALETNSFSKDHLKNFYVRVFKNQSVNASINSEPKKVNM